MNHDNIAVRAQAHMLEPAPSSGNTGPQSGGDHVVPTIYPLEAAFHVAHSGDDTLLSVATENLDMLAQAACQASWSGDAYARGMQLTFHCLYLLLMTICPTSNPIPTLNDWPSHIFMLVFGAKCGSSTTSGRIYRAVHKIRPEIIKVCEDFVRLERNPEWRNNRYDLLRWLTNFYGIGPNYYNNAKAIRDAVLDSYCSIADHPAGQLVAQIELRSHKYEAFHPAFGDWPIQPPVLRWHGQMDIQDDPKLSAFFSTHKNARKKAADRNFLRTTFHRKFNNAQIRLMPKGDNSVGKHPQDATFHVTSSEEDLMKDALKLVGEALPEDKLKFVTKKLQKHRTQQMQQSRDLKSTSLPMSFEGQGLFDFLNGVSGLAETAKNGVAEIAKFRELMSSYSVGSLLKQTAKYLPPITALAFSLYKMLVYADQKDWTSFGTWLAIGTCAIVFLATVDSVLKPLYDNYIRPWFTEVVEDLRHEKNLKHTSGFTRKIVDNTVNASDMQSPRDLFMCHAVSTFLITPQAYPKWLQHNLMHGEGIVSAFALELKEDLPNHTDDPQSCPCKLCSWRRARDARMKYFVGGEPISELVKDKEKEPLSVPLFHPPVQGQVDWTFSSKTFGLIGKLVSLSILAFSIGSSKASNLGSALRCLGDFPKLAEGSSDLCTQLLKAVEWGTNKCRAWLGFDKVKMFEDELPMYTQWRDSCEKVLEDFHRGKLVTSADNHERVMKLSMEGLKMLADLGQSKSLDKVKTAILEIVRGLARIRTVIENSGCRSSFSRTTPLTIRFVGSPGVGKSFCLIPLVTALAALTLPPEDLEAFKKERSRFVYIRNWEQKFWDGYCGQFITIVDDFLQALDAAGVPDCEIMDMIRMYGDFMHILHMANLEQKGNVSFLSRIVVLTTNFAKVESNAVRSVAAVNRRFDLSYRIYPTAAYAKNGPELPLQKSLSNNRDQWTLDKAAIRAVAPDRGFVPEAIEFQRIDHEGRPHGPMLTYEQVIAEAHAQYKVHETRSDLFGQYVNDYTDKMINIRKAMAAAPPGAFDLTAALKDAGGAKPLPPSKPILEMNPHTYVVQRPRTQRRSRHLIREEDSDSESDSPSTGSDIIPGQERAVFRANLDAEVVHSTNSQLLTFEGQGWLDFLKKKKPIPETMSELQDFPAGTPLYDPTEDIVPVADPMENSCLYDDKHRKQFDRIHYPFRQALKEYCIKKGIQLTSFFDGTYNILQDIFYWQWQYLLVYPFGKGKSVLASFLNALDNRLSDVSHIINRARSACRSMVSWISSVAQKIKEWWDNFSIVEFVQNHLGTIAIVAGVAFGTYMVGSTIRKIEDEHAYTAQEIKTSAAAEKNLEQRAATNKAVQEAAQETATYYRVRTIQSLITEGQAGSSDTWDGTKMKVRQDGKRKFKSKAPISGQRAEAAKPMEGQSAIDLNCDQLMFSLYKKNSYAMHLCGKENHMGLCLFVKGRVALIPKHFRSVLKLAVDRGEYKTTDLVLLKNLDYDTAGMTIPVQTILDARATPALEGSDLVLMQCPKSVAARADITDRFVTCDILEKRRDLDIQMMTIQRSPYLVKIVESMGSTLLTDTHASITMDDGTKVKWVVAKGLAYTLPTKVGDCGAPVLLKDPTIRKEKIVGIHTAGTGQHGMASVVTREDLTLALAEFKGEISFDYDVRPTVQTVPGGGFTALRSEKPASLASRTQIVASPLFDAWGPAISAPAKLRPGMCNGVLVNPWVKALERYKHEDTYFPPWLEALVAEACRAELQLIENSAPTPLSERRTLTFKEACQGIGDELRKIPLHTSPGYPWVLLKALWEEGKTHWFKVGIDGTWNWDDPECKKMEARVLHIIDCARKGIRLEHIYLDALKDERRKLSRVENYETRFISGSPLDLLIAFRMMFGSFMKAYVAGRIKNGSAIGVNPHSCEWDLIMKFFTSIGNKGLAGDYVGLDSSTCSMMHYKIIENVVNGWYQNATPEDNMARVILILELVNSHHIIDGLVYEWIGKMPSGNPLTAIWNTIYTGVGKRVVYALCVYRNPDGGAKLPSSRLLLLHWKPNQKQMGVLEMLVWEYDQHVRSIRLGDDHVAVVTDERIDDFNMFALQEWMPVLGMSYTDANKGPVTCAHMPLDQVTFLKRSWRFEPEYDRWIAPLDTKVTLEIPYWTKHGAGYTTITKDNFDTAMHYLAMHDPSIFEFWAPKMRAAYQERMQCSYLKGRPSLLAEALGMDDRL